MARILTMAESRNTNPNYNITNGQLRRQDFLHFVAMREGSIVLAKRVLAAGGHV